jgi:hypothetical protein
MAFVGPLLPEWTPRPARTADHSFAGKPVWAISEAISVT